MQNELPAPTMMPTVANGAEFAATGQTVIRAENLHKYYDMGETRVHALRGVSLHINTGEFVAVMGASGSGKSTLMNVIGCLDQQDSGAYYLSGVDVKDLDKRALAAVRNQKL